MGALLNKITAFNVKTWICYLKGINNLILAITLYIEQSVYCDYLVKQVIEQNKLEYLTYWQEKDIATIQWYKANTQHSSAHL